jgi:siroheme synthase (precorrin-2 oxidase/ferrochelatase)
LIFKEEGRDEEICFKMLLPSKVPLMVLPRVTSLSQNDFRKVVIIGSGEAGVACAETLRNMDYTGDITIITDSLYLPVDKKKLANDFDDFKREDIEEHFNG